MHARRCGTTQIRHDNCSLYSSRFRRHESATSAAVERAAVVEEPRGQPRRSAYLLDRPRVPHGPELQLRPRGPLGPEYRYKQLTRIPSPINNELTPAVRSRRASTAWPHLVPLTAMGERLRDATASPRVLRASSCICSPSAAACAICRRQHATVTFQSPEKSHVMHVTPQRPVTFRTNVLSVHLGTKSLLLYSDWVTVVCPDPLV
jgi:hypothetical protein